MNKAYLQSIPEDLRARLEKSENVSGFTQGLLKGDIKFCLNLVERKINTINKNNKLSEEQKDAQKQIVYSSYKDYLNDYDRIISQAGTVDACAMAAKYAQYAGKTTVAALTVETLGLSIRGIIDNLPKIIESDSYNKFLEMIGSKKFVNIRQLFENSISELDPEVKKELLANLKIEDLNKDGSINSKDISYKQFKVLTDENGKLDVAKIKWMAERAENKVKFNGFKQVIAGLSEENRQKVMDQLGISDINEIKQNNFKILEERLAAVRNASVMSDKMSADIDKAGLTMGKIPSEWKVGVGENLDKILGKVATNNNLFNGLSGNEDEIIAKKTFIINALEKKIAADPGKYGLSNIHELKPGQTIKLEGVFDQEELSKITDKANSLSEEQVKNIIKNNKAISDWVKEHPGQKLTQADGKAGEILGNKPKINIATEKGVFLNASEVDYLKNQGWKIEPSLSKNYIIRKDITDFVTGEKLILRANDVSEKGIIDSISVYSDDGKILKIYNLDELNENNSIKIDSKNLMETLDKKNTIGKVTSAIENDINNKLTEFKIMVGEKITKGPTTYGINIFNNDYQIKTQFLLAHNELLKDSVGTKQLFNICDKIGVTDYNERLLSSFKNMKNLPDYFTEEKKMGYMKIFGMKDGDKMIEGIKEIFDLKTTSLDYSSLYFNEKGCLVINDVYKTQSNSWTAGYNIYFSQSGKVFIEGPDGQSWGGTKLIPDGKLNTSFNIKNIIKEINEEHDFQWRKRF